MKKLITILLFALPVMAQQPQTQVAPIYSVNSKYANGVAPGYWPQAGAGLVLNIGKGTANCANTIVEFAGGTRTLADNTVNYVYLDTASSCAPGSNTTGFTNATIPIAKVTTLSGVITTVDDARTPFSTAIGVTSAGSGTNPKLAIWATGTTLGNIGTPTLCITGQAPTGIDANGNATGCASISGTVVTSGAFLPAFSGTGAARWAGIWRVGTGVNSGLVGDIEASSGGAAGDGATTTTPADLRFWSGYLEGRPIWLTGKGLHYYMRGRLETITGIRLWFGLSDDDWSLQGADTINGNMAAFRFSTNASDTNFQCATRNNVTTTLINSGVAADTNYHTFEIIENVGTNWVFKIDGSTVCTATLTLPTVPALMYKGADATIHSSLGMRETWQYVTASDPSFP
jgi:hypothetical protein